MLHTQDYDLTDQYSVKLIAKLELINAADESKIDLDIIKKAMWFAKKYHALQTRQSGEPFYSHTFEVAAKLSEYYFETDAIIAAIIHDMVEDTTFDISQVGFVFNQNVKNIVNRLTKLDTIDKRKLSTEWTLHKLSQDKIATTIKLLDRMHNLETIFYIKNEAKRTRIARETINIYVPLAQIMELEDIKDTLLKLAYKVLNSSISS
jgi:GTP pyrophosphokinase